MVVNEIREKLTRIKAREEHGVYEIVYKKAYSEAFEISKKAPVTKL